ncbi:unnamed protein product [Heterobilharzia americana]|nr:unnamed protein product [Heterobilharzia americana]
MDNAAHLLPHSGLLSCLPPQRILFAANPVCSNKPLSHPAIKITEENKRKHVSRESTQSISTGKYNRPTGLNFMTEKSEILDDSNMLLKHLSPHNEIRCVNTCTEVTSYQLTQCYPLCVVDRLPASGIDRNNNITSSGNPNQNNDEINTNSKDDSTNDDIFRSNTESTTTATLTVASIIATTATVITASPSSSISSASTNPRSTLPTSKLSRKPSTSMKQDNSSYSTNQQQRILRESSKRTKQANYGCGTTTPASSVSSRKKITSCSSESTSTRPLDKMTSTSSTSHTNKSSDNPDADYSGSYEGVSNSNSSHHSQSSEASSLEPDSTLSEGVLTRKCCPTKHSILQPKISTSSVKNQSSFSSSSSKVCINSDLHNPLQYSSPNKIDPSLPSPLHKNLNSSTDPSFTCLHTPVISTSASNLSSPIQDGRLSIIQESSFNSNNDNNNSNIIIPSVHINSPTSFTPCHSVDPNSILHPTSISSFNFARKPNMMIMTTSPCPGSHLPTPINHLGQPNHQTLTSNMYTAHRSMINIRPSVLSIPQKPSLQVHFAPPIRTNLCTTPTAAATTTTTNNNNSSNICSGMNKRMLLNPSFGSPVLSHPPLNQSSTINSIVSPNMLRKQYYYYE